MSLARQWFGLGLLFASSACFAPAPVELPSLETMGAKSVVITLAQARGPSVYASEQTLDLNLGLSEGEAFEASYYGCDLKTLEVRPGFGDPPSCLPLTRRRVGRHLVNRQLVDPDEEVVAVCSRCEADQLKIERAMSSTILSNRPRPVAAVLLDADRALVAYRREGEEGRDRLLLFTQPDGVSAVEVEFSPASRYGSAFGSLWLDEEGQIWAATRQQIWRGQLQGDVLVLEVSEENAPGVGGAYATFFAPEGASGPLYLASGLGNLFRRQGGVWSQILATRPSEMTDRPTALVPFGAHRMLALGMSPSEVDARGKNFIPSYALIDPSTVAVERVRVARAAGEELLSATAVPGAGEVAYVGGLDGTLRQVGPLGHLQIHTSVGSINSMVSSPDRLYLGLSEGAGIEQLFLDELSEPCLLTNEALSEAIALLRIGDRLVHVADEAVQVTFLRVSHRSECSLDPLE